MAAATQPSWIVTSQRKKAIQAKAMLPYRHLEPVPGVERKTAIDDISTLARAVAQGHLKAYDVTLAYIQQAISTHDKTNCLTEILFEEALDRAKVLDEHLETTGKTAGPLHGVPFTVKNQFNVKGYDSSIGYVGRAFKPADEDADVVKILREAGAIVIAKTNLPQSIMWCETENMLWGRTNHPYNTELTPGGSTGGESALLAMHGTVLGWEQQDIGGSVRIPAHMTGVYGFKPSSERLPYAGVPVSTEGQEHVPSSVGPMARSLPSIESVMRLIIQAEPWRDDPRLLCLPWNEKEYESVQDRTLVIGLLLDDGVVKVHPPIERIVRDVASKLEKAGHRIVPWSADGHAECIEVMDQFYTADGGADIKRDMAVGGEPYLPRVQDIVSKAPAISVLEYWALNQRKRAVQTTYLKKWQAIRDPNSGQEVDILLTPVMPHSAVRHRACKWVGYTKVWNLLDYTAIVLPAGKVDKEVDPPKGDPGVRSYEPRNEWDQWNWELYDPELMHNLPVGIQLVGRKLEEEKVLGAAKVVQRVLDMSSTPSPAA